VQWTHKFGESVEVLCLDLGAIRASVLVFLSIALKFNLFLFFCDKKFNLGSGMLCTTNDDMDCGM
jgi:hypothetical protein